MQLVFLAFFTEVELFQSMHPIKDATQAKKQFDAHIIISIHAPYKGCNGKVEGAYIESKRFQSMHPIKDATF